MKQCLKSVGFDVLDKKSLVNLINDAKTLRSLKYRNKIFYTAEFDDCIILKCVAEFTRGNKPISMKFSLGYRDNNLYFIQKKEKVINDEWKDQTCITLQDADYSFNILQVYTPPFKLQAKERIVSNIACFVTNIKCFHSPDDYSLEFEDLSVKSLCPFGKHQGSNIPMMIINGTIVDFKLKENSHTGLKYYHIEVESYLTKFVLLAEESMITTPLYKGLIVSATCICTGDIEAEYGNSCFFDYVDGISFQEFSSSVLEKIVSLRDIRYDFVSVSFENNIRDDITFIQTAKCGDNYLVEIGKTVNGEPYLFRKCEVDLPSVLKIFYLLCIEKSIPDLTEWKDVTEEVIKKKKHAKKSK